MEKLLDRIKFIPDVSIEILQGVNNKAILLITTEGETSTAAIEITELTSQDLSHLADTILNAAKELEKFEEGASEESEANC